MSAQRNSITRQLAEICGGDNGQCEAERNKLVRGGIAGQRTAQGWTQVELGKRIGYSGSFVSDVERGERAPSEDFRQRCDEAFGLPGTLARLYEDLRRNAYPPFFAPVLPYEREADRISGWRLAVPGLLQTERYGRGDHGGTAGASRRAGPGARRGVALGLPGMMPGNARGREPMRTGRDLAGTPHEPSGHRGAGAHPGSR